MPVAKFQLPDGRIGRFEVPDGTTPDQAQSLIEQHVSGNPDLFSGPQTNAQPADTPEKQDISRIGAAFDQGLQGATFGFSDEISDRIGSLIAAAVMSGGENGTFGQNYSNFLKEARATTKARLAQEQEEMPITSTVANLAGGIATLPVIGAAGQATKIGPILRSGKVAKDASRTAKAGNLALNIAKGGATGAAAGAAYGAGTADDGQRLEGAESGAKIGAVIGGAVPVVTAGANAVAKAAVPKIPESIKPLVKRAQGFGIELRADQVSDSKVRNTIQKVSQEVPFSGAGNFEEKQIGQWHSALAKTIGEDADNLGPETITNFLEKTSATYDNALKGETVQFPRNAFRKLDNIYYEAEKSIRNDLSAIIKKNIEEVGENIEKVGENIDQATGTIDGEKMASLISKIKERSVTAEGGAKKFLNDIVDILDDETFSSISPKKAADLKTVRGYWRNFKTMEPLLEKSTDGLINPTELLTQVKKSKYIKASRASVGKDDLVDLARIGKKFLVKKGGSDTFQKSAMGAGAVGLLGTAAANPVLGAVLAAKAGAGLGANRAYQSLLNQNQALIRAGLKDSVKQIPNVSSTPIIGAHSIKKK